MKAMTIAVVATILTGCTVERTVITEPPTTEASPRNTQATIYEREELFVSYLRDEYGLASYLSQDAINVGWETCNMAEDGATTDDFLDMIYRASTDQADMEFLSAVVAGALVILCPQFEHLLGGSV